MSRILTRALLTLGLLAGIRVSAEAQILRGVVVDQTGQALPGVRIQQWRGTTALAFTRSGLDGTFELPRAEPADQIEATLNGFETIRVAAAHAGHIVMVLAKATDEAVVAASMSQSSGVATEKLGTTLTGADVQKLAVARPRVLESLPLLPSVVRGADGLLRLDGTRPHEAALWIDGFDVTDPVTGSSAIDLPLEGVQGMAVLRDPMAATYGGILGALATVDTVTGGDHFEGGVQGFIPRPRLSRYGFGHIEGFFPRAYVGGRQGAVRYFGTQEFDFERVPVPGVTTRAGRPNIGEVSATSFGRVDIDVSLRQVLTIETIYVPGWTSSAGLSPLQEASASPSVQTCDVFGGVIDRWVLGKSDVITVRVGILAHETSLGTHHDGVAQLTPVGWRDNWFASVDHRATRRTASFAWQRTGITGTGRHTVTLAADAQWRTMTGTLAASPIQIEDDNRQVVRVINFAPSNALRAADQSGSFVAHDVWEITRRVQVDVGGRIDWYALAHQAVPSPRIGLRYLLNTTGTTVLKAGAGRFVGRVPLDALAFGAFPSRTDATVDAATGEVVSVLTQRFALGSLRLPYADTATVEIERQLRPGLDVQVGARERLGARLPTVAVSDTGGLVSLASTGRSAYREVQVAVRQTWSPDTQVFLSYVRSTTRGELNDFGSLFTDMPAPALEPGGYTVSADDVPHRVVGWGSAALLRGFAISPAVEWHTGFAYSTLDLRRHYLGAPNTARYPDFFSLDLVGYKTVELSGRAVNLGVQLFNVTQHFNPRGVMPVVGTSHFRQFTNSVGLTVGGYLMVKWQ